MDAQEIKFPSKPENQALVERFVTSIFDELGIDHVYFGMILTVLDEAVSNAIKHGNKNNPEKSVHLIFESKPEGISFIVRDEGDGFDYNKLPDPTLEDEDGKFFEGKGIFKIRSLADNVNFFDGGRAIETLFNIPGVNHKISAQRVKHLKTFFKEKFKTVYREH